MSRFPPPPAKLRPLTNSQSPCRRLNTEYVDILGLNDSQLSERHAWCREQAMRLRTALHDMSHQEIQRLLVTEWDLSAAEAAWVVSALP